MLEAGQGVLLPGAAGGCWALRRTACEPHNLFKGGWEKQDGVLHKDVQAGTAAGGWLEKSKGVENTFLARHSHFRARENLGELPPFSAVAGISVLPYGLAVRSQQLPGLA